MTRRDLAQRARLSALTRAAYEATEGVAGWDETPTAEPPAARGHQGRTSRGRPRRIRLTGRALAGLVLVLAVVVGIVVLRTALEARATTLVPASPVASEDANATAAPSSAPDTAPTESEATGAPTESETTAATDPPDTSPAGATTPGTPAPSTVVVHVAGEVLAPGVVEVPAGSRVVDAVTAAGGPTDQADLDVINLARVVVDGEQIYVPAPGETPPASGTPPAPPGGGSPAGGGETGALVNLNTADLAALDELPGIGPALAARIVAWREEHGGFQSVAELDEVSGIGPVLLEQLTDLVTV